MWATHGWPTLARPPGPCEHSSLWWRGGNATPQSFSQQLGPPEQLLQAQWDPGTWAAWSLGLCLAVWA